MILKLTTEYDLFSFPENQEEQSWVDDLTSTPLNFHILSASHMYQYTYNWNKNYMCSQVWYHFKNL